MKRISLMLALFLTLSFGMAYGANPGAITLGSVTGLAPFGGIAINASPAVFTFNYDNTANVTKAKGITNGYEISATGGINWVGTYAHATGAGALDWNGFDLVISLNEFSWDGALADTIGFAGSVMTGPGMPAGFNGPAVVITVDATGATVGETICIDSCYYPPAGTWMWAFGDGTGTPSQPPTWDGPHCYLTEEVLDQCPVWVDAPTAGGGDHCDLVVLQYFATDPDATPGGVTYAVLAGVGAIGATSGQYTYAPVLGDVGASIGATIEASDAAHNAGDCTPVDLVLNFTNEAPIFTSGIGDTVAVGMGNCVEKEIGLHAVDCDPWSVNVVSVTPSPSEKWSVEIVITDSSFYIKIIWCTVAPDDGGQIFDVELEVTDGVGSSIGHVFFDVLLTEPFEVQIEKTHNTLQGMHEIVDVTVNAGSEDMGGFDILIAYDASALNFQAAIPGDLHTDCGWEYFNYRYGAFGNCGNQCPSGMLRVVGIAETNNGPNHPSCLMLPVPFVLFSMDFLVSNDRTLECQYVPIRFFWMDCGDNSIAYHPADDPLASIQGVSRYVIDFDLIGHIEDMYTGFPTYTGVQAECLVGGGDDKPAPNQFVDFLNGGVDIVCADSIDDRGDINLNGTANEIADAVLFSNYFVKGIGVFNVNYQGQVAASDVNADGLTLSVADLVYLIRVIVGDALPYPKLGAEAATYAYENGTMSVDTKMGAAFIVIEGNVNPTLLANNMDMSYQYDGLNTRVLVSKIERGAGFDGEFLSFDGRVVSVEFATYDGAPVAQKNVPTSYSLAQNYPNPFNGMTRIAFGMPTAGDYSLTIYNVTGQKVADFSGSAAAGQVEISWDATDQASGVYFYKLDTENFTDTKKMVYLK